MTRLAVAVCVLLAAFAGSARGGAGDPQRTVRLLLGHSVEGRPIVAVGRGDLDSPRRMLVVGCIHGNECAGLPVAQLLERTPAPPETALWIVPQLNPDGAHADTRVNAHGVDLNRNFPWRWTHLSGVYDSGPAPASEPETRIAMRLVEQVRPGVSIWFHQHLDVVDDSSGDPRLERRFAAAAGLPLARLTREPGSAVTWESHRFPRSSPFVVELPAGRLPGAEVARLAAAVRSVARVAPG